VHSGNRQLFANKELMLSKAQHGLWHVSGKPVCWSLPPSTVVSQLEFSVFGRLTQKPGIEARFAPALRSGALQWKGSPQAGVRNAMAAILKLSKN